MIYIEAENLPQFALQHIFSYLSLKDIQSCMLVCKRWNIIIEHYSDTFWRNRLAKLTSNTTLKDLTMLNIFKKPRLKVRAIKCSWNPRDTSKNMFVKPNGITVHRHPVAQSTDGIRGSVGVKSGVHAWEIIWEGPLGTVAIVGIATRHAALHCPGYHPLLGSDDQSWGWNLVNGNLQHNGEVLCTYPRRNNAPKYKIGEKIRMILDCDQGLLYFEKGHDFLGIAFDDIPPLKLYPAICAVYGNTEVSMVYIGPPLAG